ncbi:MAG TPA: hypothetical protein VGM37_00595 [Armatimonadota bacterium]|jgi:hypothetical protein
MSEQRLSHAERRRIAAEVKRALEDDALQIYAKAAGEAAAVWIPPPSGAPLKADYLLTKAIDRYMDGRLSEEDLFRIRCVAFYLVFGIGGEEWSNMGVAFGLSMGSPRANE